MGHWAKADRHEAPERLGMGFQAGCIYALHKGQKEWGRGTGGGGGRWHRTLSPTGTRSASQNGQAQGACLPLVAPGRCWAGSQKRWMDTTLSCGLMWTFSMLKRPGCPASVALVHLGHAQKAEIMIQDHLEISIEQICINVCAQQVESSSGLCDSCVASGTSNVCRALMMTIRWTECQGKIKSCRAGS